MLMTSIQTHAEKVRFVKSFIKGELKDYPPDRPLMIIGSGANGKSYVIREVAQMAPVNLIIFQESGGSFTFVPAISPSHECAMLMAVNGSSEDFALAKSLNAHVVSFEKDPAYA